MKLLWKIIITTYILVAIIAYIISPDNTENANTQIPQIALLTPNSKITLIKIILKPNNKNILQTMLSGNNEQATYIPLKPNSKYIIKNDTIYFTNFLGEKQKIPFNNNVKIISKKYLLGTDNLGRDYLSRLIIGSRVSLFVGFIAMLLSSSFGFITGSVAAFIGGKIDQLFQWLIGTLWTIPSVLLALILSFILGTGTTNLIITIFLVSWIDTARIIRGKTLELKNKEFILAAKSLGLNNTRILIKHIFPNLWKTLAIVSISTLSSAILLEAGLSFLGFGVEPPTPSWGNLISENYPYLMINNLSHLAITPGITIALLITSLYNLIQQK